MATDRSDRGYVLAIDRFGKSRTGQRQSRDFGTRIVGMIEHSM
ncbi:MAG: hypothetical protein OXC66_11240 [Roseovarius sp.]|nr:hypothetical protein [Roseovarius sp.]